MIDSKTSYRFLSSTQKEFLPIQKGNEKVRLLTMSIQDRIKKRRQELGLSQGELARRIGISRAAVSQWETQGDKGTSPDGENLIKCAIELQTTPEYLLYGREEIPYLIKEKLKIFNSPPEIQLPILENSEIIIWALEDKLPNNYRSFPMFIPIITSKKSCFMDITLDSITSYLLPHKKATHGAWAVIDLIKEPSPADWVVILINNEILEIRQYIQKGNEVILVSPDPKMPHLKLSEAKILAVILTYFDLPIDSNASSMIEGGGVKSPLNADRLHMDDTDL